MSKDNSDSTIQSIEELQARFERLNTRRIQVETQLEQEQKRLAELKAEAKERFGTDDLNSLKEQLQKLEAENAQKRKDYQASLDLIERELAKVEDANQPKT
ncbi:MAG: hypothetical protein R3C03_12920 [Pirellulaceae bacterium]